MKNTPISRKISVLILSLFCFGSLWGKTLSGDLKNEVDFARGLVAWYPFEGDASDASGNDRNGTVHGATLTQDRHGRENNAYEFDGEDDYIRVNHDKIFNNLPLSVGVWFKSDGNAEETGIVSKYWSGNWNGWQIMERNGRIIPWYLRSARPKRIVIGDYGENKSFNSSYTKATWNHITTVFSENGGKLFVNGKFADDKNWTGTPSPTTSKVQLDIGLYKGTGKRGFFKGSIDEVRIYDRVLSDEEVSALYELESTNQNDDRPTPPPPPETGGLTPPDPDYKETIAELKRLLAEKDKKLAHCEKEMDAKDKEIGNLTSENAKLEGEVKSLNGKVTNLEKEVATLKSDKEGLNGQIQNLREDNQNLSYELTTTTEIEEHTSELQSHSDLVCRLLLEKKKTTQQQKKKKQTER